MMRLAGLNASSLQVVQPTHHELALDMLPSSSIEKHYVLPSVHCRAYTIYFIVPIYDPNVVTVVHYIFPI